MNKVLVTGPTRFLGYHVIKQLNEKGICPLVLIDAKEQIQPDQTALSKKEYKTALNDWKAYQSMKLLDVEEILGNVNDPDSLQTACKGIDTIFHLKFGLGFGDSDEVKKQLYQVNVVGTNNLLDAAEKNGVERVVVSSSALTVGLNVAPEPLNEDADWATHQFNLPYAVSRREAEMEAIKRPKGNKLPTVVVINPSFTMGPDDYVNAPANGLVKNMAKFWFRFTAPIGYGILDVRDYAQGALLAAEKGKHGQRYILSGHDVSSDILIKQIAEINGQKPPEKLVNIPSWLVSLLLRIAGLSKGVPITKAPTIVELWGKNAWYDSSLAQKELGWKPTTLRKTLEDTLIWKAETTGS